MKTIFILILLLLPIQAKARSNRIQIECTTVPKEIVVHKTPIFGTLTYIQFPYRSVYRVEFVGCSGGTIQLKRIYHAAQ